MYSFDDGNTKLCLTSDECVSRKAFVRYDFINSDHTCLTGTQCRDECGSCHPYNEVGLCVSSKPDDSLTAKDGGYECETGYLYISLWD